MPAIADALFEDRHGVVIAIEVTAGAKTNAFPAGYNEWRKMIGCRVSAPAVGGKANRAVIVLVAEKLGLPAASVSILSGSTASQKRILVAGITRDELLTRLAVPE
ncbi:MAG: DUF167 domain-containing protein [Methanoregula sp.]|nr:DUF167 domain-containing protein [Methanoregula sp.]